MENANNANKNNKIPLIVVAGPTASGKTALGVEICKAVDGEVVSADSMQIYKYLNIGTAKPTLEEMQGIPHHLLDLIAPDQVFSVADYVEKAHQIISEIHARGKRVVVVGGTGLYINSLVNNITFSETKTDWVLRHELENQALARGNQFLWEQLNSVDPKTAAALHPNNLGRVVRAIEIYRTTGKPMSEHQEHSRSNPSPYKLCMFGLDFEDRQDLYDRINLRVSKMLEDGLVQEAESLMQSGWFDKNFTSLQAIGYKEMLSYLKGEETLEQAADRIRQGTRNYAKRQLTWFRKDPRYHWIYFGIERQVDAVLSILARAD